MTESQSVEDAIEVNETRADTGVRSKKRMSIGARLIRMSSWIGVPMLIQHLIASASQTLLNYVLNLTVTLTRTTDTTGHCAHTCTTLRRI